MKNIKGGVKIKKQQEGNIIQKRINEKLKKTIDMNVFIKQTGIKLVANTYGIVCPNCHIKDNIYAETVQTRSSDEASDRLCTCLSCGYHWKISGS